MFKGANTGLGLLVSQLNNYTLAPVDEDRVSEAAGVNSAAGNFGLSFGLAFAGGILLAVLSFTCTDMVVGNPEIPAREQEQLADALEHDAEVMSRTQLDALITEQPPAVRLEGRGCIRHHVGELMSLAGRTRRFDGCGPAPARPSRWRPPPARPPLRRPRHHCRYRRRRWQQPGSPSHSPYQ